MKQELFLILFLKSLQKPWLKIKNVRLVDFGTFEVKQRAERMGHNPKNWRKLKIEAKEIVTFKQGKALGEQFIVKPKQKVKLEESLIFLSSFFLVRLYTLELAHLRLLDIYFILDLQIIPIVN